MNSITNLWLSDKKFFEKKTLTQILSFAGDGKLKDNNNTSTEFREFIAEIPSVFLKYFSDSCLIEKFEDSGFALQDIINQVGSRLDFIVENGLYRGRQNDIGFDGIWNSKSGHSFVLEVKTTDAYRINLDTLATYRAKLIQHGKIKDSKSSILIVVGRQDTGDLEAQIRGSKHCWDIRLLSIDSLFKLLEIKESLNDLKTVSQINEILKPKEYTKLDELIELIFLTSKDLQIEAQALEDDPTIEEESTKVLEPIGTNNILEIKTPSNRQLQEECIELIERALTIKLKKKSRISYASIDNSVGVICASSKKYVHPDYDKYWFSVFPYQIEFLKSFKNSYVAFVCNSINRIILIPFSDFEIFLKNLNISEKDERMWWHIFIFKIQNKYYIGQPIKEKSLKVEITNYLIIMK